MKSKYLLAAIAILIFIGVTCWRCHGQECVPLTSEQQALQQTVQPVQTKQGIYFISEGPAQPLHAVLENRNGGMVTLWNVQTNSDDSRKR